MKVPNVLKTLVLMALVAFLFALFPGRSWGEHPWDENKYSKPDTLSEEEILVLDPDPDPADPVEFLSLGTPLLWLELILNNPIKDSGASAAGLGSSSSTSTTTKGENMVSTR